MDYNSLIDKSQQITKRLDLLHDETEMNTRKDIVENTINDLKYIEIALHQEKFKIIGDIEKDKIVFTNINKIHAIQDYFRQFENKEISTQVAECYINSFIFYVDTLPQDIPEFESCFDVVSCYIRPIY